MTAPEKNVVRFVLRGRAVTRERGYFREVSGDSTYFFYGKDSFCSEESVFEDPDEAVEAAVERYRHETRQAVDRILENDALDLDYDPLMVDLKADAVKWMICPHCLAQPGNPCTDGGGRVFLPVHVDRTNRCITAFGAERYAGR